MQHGIRGFCLCLFLLSCTQPIESSVSSSLTTIVSVLDYGAVGDGLTDDRAAFESAIAAGDIIEVPAGHTYRLTQAGTHYWCIRVLANKTLRGTGGMPVLLEDSLVTMGTNLIDVEADGVTVENLELVGQRSVQPVDEHKHGLLANLANNLIVNNVESHDFTGDGFYLYNGVNNAKLSNLYSHGNNRNGLTLGGTSSDITVTGSRFIASAAQQFDSEAPSGHQDNVTLTGNTFDVGGVSNQYVLTISGSSETVTSKNWLVQGNTFNGGIIATYAEGTKIQYNQGTNPTQFSSVKVYRVSKNVHVGPGNVFSASGLGSGVGVIYVAGTAGGPPRGTVIEGNTLSSSTVTNGIRAEGAASLTIRNNVLTGPGLASFGLNSAGLYFRATFADPLATALVPNLTWDTLSVVGNKVAGWGWNGMAVVGNGLAPLWSADIYLNDFTDTSGNTTAAMTLDADGAHALNSVHAAGNVIGGTVTTMFRTSPSGTHSSMGDSWVKP
jgi:hypothetical protein